MRLSEMGLDAATLACLHRGGINTTYRLLDHTYRELIWHSEITPEALYDILRALRRHGMTLKPHPSLDLALSIRAPGWPGREYVRLDRENAGS